MRAVSRRPISRAAKWILPLAWFSLALPSCELFDIFPPEVKIISPTNNASYVNTLPIELKATDNRNVAKVEVFLDGVSVHEFTKEPYEASLDISGRSAGTKTFKATAYDKAGNHSDAELQVRIVKETVSTPNAPSGSSSGNVNTSYSYSTGGANSNAGHSLEYRLDWGGSSYSNWSSSTSASHSWSSAGTYSVKAQARCASHTSVVSSWSSSKTVTIGAPAETVSTPSTPSGNSSGDTNTSYSYYTGGASSSLGHSIQYRFDWGGGNYSGWSSSTSASHSWSSAGTKNVKAQARCATHTSVVSSLSSSKTVTISASAETVSTPNTPVGNSSGSTGTSYSYSTGGASSSLGHNIQYRFDWGDGNYSNWSSSTSDSHSWSSGGTYSVKARARCTTHTSVLSNWSSVKSVTISGESITTPSTPTGPSSGNVGTSYSYTTGGSNSSLGHNIQYRFDWGDGNYSTWSSSTSASHSWSNAGTYSVKAQARCAAHTAVVSSWSDSIVMTISVPSITVTSPNGGEEWIEESIQTITWTSTGDVGENLSLYYSLDGGVNWTPIESTTLNDGSYSWTLPNVTRTTSTCRVKVSSISGSVFDISNDNFIVIWSPVLLASYDTPGDARGIYVLGSYAYIADVSSGLHIFNISDPSRPTLNGSYDTPHAAYGIFVVGNYAYVADASTLQIINAIDKFNPTFAGSFSRIGGYANDAYVSGDYAYVAYHSYDSNFDEELRIINVSNPASPSLAGSYDLPLYAYSIVILNDYAYMAGGTAGLQIIDISNPSSPSLAGDFNTPGHAEGVFVSTPYAYIADGGYGLRIVNVSNPSNPTHAGYYDTPSIARDVFVNRGYAFIADGTSGVIIIDVSNPSTPTLVGSYDTPDDAYGIYVSDSYAYVADGQSGLLIFDISELP